jgi:hypothetical protein
MRDRERVRRASPGPPRTRPTGRQRAVVLAGMAALTAVGVGLVAVGLSAVRNSTAGEYQQTTAPEDPGYQASVVPTPTMAVLQRGPGGVLVGASLLSLEPGDAGGSVLLVPPATVVPPPAGGPGAGPAEGATGTPQGLTIAEVYRTQGAAAAAEALGRVLTVGVDEFTEVDDDRWTRLLEPVGTVDVTLDDPVGEWPAGPVTLAPEDVGRFLSARAEDETDLDRLDRQQMFWNAWLPLVAEAGPAALPGEVGSGIGRFVLGVAGGDGAAAQLPVRRQGDAAGVTFEPDGALLGDFVAAAVPFPTSPAPGARIRVRLLNGTGDPALTELAARDLVAAGAEIAIAGNAPSLDVDRTTFAYTGAEHEASATWLSTFFGGGTLEEVPLGDEDGRAPVASDEEIDVTVILGHDAEDLMER